MNEPEIWTLYYRRCTNAQQTCEKVLNIVTGWLQNKTGMWDTISHPLEWIKSKGLTPLPVDEDTKQLERTLISLENPSCALGHVSQGEVESNCRLHRWVGPLASWQIIKKYYLIRDGSI